MSQSVQPLSVALVGFGYWGANLARNIDAATTTRLASVIESDPHRLAAAQERFPLADTTQSLDQALGDPAIDAIVLATPARTHASLAEKVMTAGKHVLVEKPLAMTSDEADRLVKLAADRALICMAGHTFLYSDPVRRLRDYVRSGELGTLRYLYSQRLNLGRVRDDCNVLWNFGPHDVSIILYLLDERPSEVSARAKSFLQPRIEDVCFATIEFPSGVVANIQLSWIDPRKVRLMTVVGDQKMAVYDDVSADRKISLFDSGVSPSAAAGEFSSMGDFQWRTRPGSIEVPYLPLREPLLTEMEEFARACRSGEPPVTDTRHGAEVVRILEAIDRSTASSGRPVELAW